jgi:deoxyribose-phosphate aldolase
MQEGGISVQSRGERRHLVPRPVDQVGVEERAASFTKRSIKTDSKLQALYRVIEMIDLTTLEGADTPGRVKQLCSKAKHPAPPLLFQELSSRPRFRPLPHVAAVCVYPNLVPVAVEALKGTGIEIASVATSFPSGQVPLQTKLEDVKIAVDFGATEIDMVINRGAFLSGDYQKVFDEIAAVKEACGTQAHLKTILETGELGTLDNVRMASDLAMEAGSDFIKTSTGKIQPAATLPVTLVMLQAIFDYYRRTGRKIGMKPAGGIRDAKTALHYLVMVKETLGEEWLTPKMFRFGASVLLNDVLRQICKELTGRYYYERTFSAD